MQLIRKIAHKKNRISGRFFVQTKLQVVAGGCIWVAGLLIAGSDSPYMPWLNGAGAIVFSGASLALGKLLPRLDPDASVSFSNDRLPCFMPGGKKHRVKKHGDSILSCVVISRGRIFSNF